jgi:hypothetical protein
MVKGERCRTIFLSVLLGSGIWVEAGCKRTPSKFTGEPAVAAQPATAQAHVEQTAAAQPREPAAGVDELFQAMRAATARRSFQAKVETEVDGERGGFDLEFAAPDRYRMRGAGFEFVIIGREGYLKLENQWQKAPRDEADTSNTFNVGNAPVFWGEAAIPKLKPQVTLKFVAATVLAGQPAKLIEYEMTGEYDGVKSRAVLTWLNYGASLKIETPPVP